MDTSTSLPPVAPSTVCNAAPRTIQIEFPQHSSSLLESLNRHRLEGKFCDVSLLVQDRELRAHKAVLAAASPYFHDKLLLGDAPRLTLPSVIEADAFEGLLQLIYTGRLHLPLDSLPAHLLVASGLQMWQVVDQCSEILKELEASSGGISARGATPYHTLSTASSTGGWCIRSPPFQAPVQSSPSPSTESPVVGEGSELGEVLQIQVEEDEEEEEEEDEDQGSEALSQTPQPQRVSGDFPRLRGSHPSPKATTPSKLPEGDSAPSEPLTTSTALPLKIFYLKQEPLELKEEVSGSGTQTGGTKEETKVFPRNTEKDGELEFLLPSGTSSGGGGPSWKPVDLHGNEILSAGGGPGGTGQAVHGPVKLGEAPPADGKRFGCLCGKRFAVKPKRDRHIMLTFSLRPFGCGVCNKRFKLKHHLTEHMKTHAGALHACPHCGRRFRVHACFLRHQDLCKGQGWATAHWTYK